MHTMKEAIGLFLFHCQYEKNLTEKTLKAYGTDLRQFMSYLKMVEHSMMVSDVSKDVIRGHLKELFEDYKPRSIKRKIATLKAYAKTENRIQNTFFGTTSQQVRLLVKANAESVLDGQKVTPHMFRHTVATMLLENGVDICNNKKIGEKSLQTSPLFF